MAESADHIEAQDRRIAELEAARIAYASEFPLRIEGDPDVGSIHQNIRLMKKRIAELDANAIDAERYRFLRKLENDKNPQQYDDVVDAAMRSAK
jgi:methylaspartate ammonia-lyase